MMEFTLAKIEDWDRIIDEILPLKHSILLLNGNLGAGKTTFTQILLRKLGSRDEASSPTYSIVNEYGTPAGKVYHFDLYRLKTPEEAYETGIDEYLDSGALCIIEWPDVYAQELAQLPHHTMRIENHGEHRTVNFI